MSSKTQSSEQSKLKKDQVSGRCGPAYLYEYPACERYLSIVQTHRRSHCMGRAPSSHRVEQADRCVTFCPSLKLESGTAHIFHPISLFSTRLVG